MRSLLPKNKTGYSNKGLLIFFLSHLFTGKYLSTIKDIKNVSLVRRLIIYFGTPAFFDKNYQVLLSALTGSQLVAFHRLPYNFYLGVRTVLIVLR